MNSLYFGTIFLPKLIDEQKKLRKIIKTELAGDIISISPHHVSFKTEIELDKSDDDYKILEKLGQVSLKTTLCAHGFVIIEVSSEHEIDADFRIFLKNYVTYKINELRNTSSLFQYEKSLTEHEIKTVLPKIDVFASEFGGYDLIKNAVSHYCDFMNSIIKKNYSGYTQNSYRKENQYSYAGMMLLIHKIIRGHYLRLFYSPKNCSFIKDVFKYHEITTDIGNLLEYNRGYFTLLTNPSQRFIPFNENDEIFVICMDIEKFTHDITSNFYANIDDQRRKFEILTKTINTWLEEHKVPMSRYWITCMGDGYMIAFKDAHLPYQLAQIIQSELEKNNEIKITLRIGLNVGTVKSLSDSWEREELIGPGMNNANRIMNFGDGGHILSSLEFIEKIKLNFGIENVPGSYLGEQNDKHGFVHKLWNLYNGSFGNKDIPKKIALQTMKN